MIIFVIVSVTGPVLGIIIGGAIVQKCAGGYEGKHSLAFCLGFAAMAFLCALPIRIVMGIYTFGIVLWAVLFFGGAVIPNLQGVMISSLKKDSRAAGNSISNIFQNLLGFLPAPFVYGIIFENTKSTDPKLAMTIVLWYSFIGVMFIFSSMIVRYRKESNQTK